MSDIIKPEDWESFNFWYIQNLKSRKVLEINTEKKDWKEFENEKLVRLFNKILRQKNDTKQD